MGTQILKKIFLDTSPLIYYLSEDSNFKAQMDKIFFSISGKVEEVVTSIVTCSEYLVYPYRTKNEKAVMALYEFIKTVNAKVIDIDMKISVKAAKIRAEYPHFKLYEVFRFRNIKNITKKSKPKSMSIAFFIATSRPLTNKFFDSIHSSN